MPDPYDYRATLKSVQSDELVNTYLLRPIAGLLVRMMYPTRVTPNQITLASIAAGLMAAFLYSRGDPSSVLTGGLCITLKDVLDSADGQLARAKQQFSRKGRFLDSIGDFVVTVAVFAAIGWALTRSAGDAMLWIWAALAGACMTLRISYHVFYHTSFLHLGGAYQSNRLTEEITPDDREGDATTLVLQRIYQALYGWQDRLMFRIDAWCRRERMDEEFRQRWYGDRAGLLLSGFLGIGTELFALMLFSVTGQLEWYLWFNLIVMNGVFVASCVYRRWGIK
jgi:phosphatidylglycerophosphate synthase